MGVRGKTTLELLRTRGGLGSHGRVPASAAATITLVGTVGEECYLPAQPADIRALPPIALGPKVDMTRYNGARVLASVLAPGAETARALVMWSSDQLTWFPLGTDDAYVSLAAVNDLAVGDAVGLRSTCTGEVWLAAMVDGGDGEATPALGWLAVQLLPDGTRVPAPGAVIVGDDFEDADPARWNVDWPIISSTGYPVAWQGGDSQDPNGEQYSPYYAIATDLDGETLENTSLTWEHTYGLADGLAADTRYRIQVSMKEDGVIGGESPYGINVEGEVRTGAQGQHQYLSVYARTNGSGALTIRGFHDLTQLSGGFIRALYFDSVQVLEWDGGISLPDAATIERWISETAVLGPVTRLRPPDGTVHGTMYYADMEAEPPVLRAMVHGLPGQVPVLDANGVPTWGTLSGGIVARSLLRSPDGSPLLSPDGSSLIVTS